MLATKTNNEVHRRLFHLIDSQSTKILRTLMTPANAFYRDERHTTTTNEPSFCTCKRRVLGVKRGFRRETKDNFSSITYAGQNQQKLRHQQQKQQQQQFHMTQFNRWLTNNGKDENNNAVDSDNNASEERVNSASTVSNDGNSETEKNYALDALESPQPSEATEIPGAQTGGKKLAIIYTCKVCETRAIKQFSEQAYQHGVVLVRCPGCQNLHLIADNLGFFKDDDYDANGQWNIQEALAKLGQEVKAVTDDNVLEMTMGDIVGEEKIEKAVASSSSESSSSSSSSSEK